MAKSSIKIKSRIEETARNLPKLAARIIKRESFLTASHIRSHHLTGGTTDDKLAVRTGRLRSSVRPAEVIEYADGAAGGITFGTVYARVHVGPKGQVTIIRAKPPRRFLTIPLEAAKTSAGVSKGTAPGGPWGKTFFARSKRGNLILFGQQQITKGRRMEELRGKIVPLFLLKEKVEVKARVHPEVIMDWMEPRIINAFKKEGVIK